MATSEGGSSHPRQGGARLGGVRADFVANLGKHLVELQALFDALSSDPGSALARDEFSRRLHALTTRSQILKFEAMASRLEAAEHCLERAAGEGGIDADDIIVFDNLLRDLPALAWNEVGAKGAESDAPMVGDGATKTAPLAVLVLGPVALVEALRDAETATPNMWELEHETTLTDALELARVFAPDVLVLDGDMIGARDLVESLSLDPLTDAVPTVVLGSWSSPERAAAFLACGVAKALAKPVSPAKLRRAVVEAASSARVPDVFTGLGTVTVDQLAEVLIDQVRSGIVDTAKPESRRLTVDLGDGAEVLAAVWGAVARVREMLTIQSQGAIRFSNTGPLGAVPVAPWLELRTGDQVARREAGRDPAKEVKLSLDGRRVLIIDDDPAVTWFLSGLFVAHGASVAEAHDGQQGLDLAYKFGPELVITDILMPKLDGFALCRALKRDVVLRDVPVILLSWKEDLLQRMRELGVGADGYLRKEATSSAILRTVHESLRPRSRIEARLARGGEVRGRLDGLTARTLLSLVKRTQPDAWVNVRDASFLFELQVKDGRLRSAVRTAQDGSFIRGEEALISLLGIISGRFQVVPSEDPAEGTLDADIDDLIAPAVAESRAAQVLLRGARLPNVKAVGLRRDRLMLNALPDSARAVYQALDAGRSPASVLRELGIDAGILEKLLSDAAARVAVGRVEDADGNDLLARETKERLRELEQPSLASRRRRDAPPRIPSERAPGTLAPALPEAPRGANGMHDAARADPSQTDQILAALSIDDGPHEVPGPVPPGPPCAATSGPNQPGTGPATSLAEAVMREVADATGSKAPPPMQSPSMLDASELKPRTTARPEPARMPSLPPDAIVPGIDSLPPERSPSAEEPSVPALPSIPPVPKASLVFRGVDLDGEAKDHDDGDSEDDGDDSEDDGDDSEDDGDDSEDDVDDSEDDVDDSEDGDDSEDDGDDSEDDGDSEDTDPPTAKRGTEASAQTARQDAETVPEKSLAVPILLVLLLCVAVIAGAMYVTREKQTPPPPKPGTPVAQSSEPPLPTQPGAASAGVVTPSAADRTDDTKREDLEEPTNAGVEEDLTPSNPERLSADEGELQVVTGEAEASVTVDGEDVGTGVTVRKVLRSGNHIVMVVWRGQQVRQRVRIAPAKMTRLTVEDEWEP